MGTHKKILKSVFITTLAYLAGRGGKWRAPATEGWSRKKFQLTIKIVTFEYFWYKL